MQEHALQVVAENVVVDATSTLPNGRSGVLLTNADDGVGIPRAAGAVA